jgi:hypothetical protein
MLAALQDTLASLVTDARCRARFLADPDAALRGLELSEPERATLRALPADALERYAQGLLHKRSQELVSALPLTRRAVPSLAARYRRWLAIHPCPVADGVLDPGLAEGLRALPALWAELRDDPGQAIYAADLLAFELRRAAAAQDAQERQLRARFRVHELARSIGAGVLPLDPDPAATWYRFRRGGVDWRAA